MSNAVESGATRLDAEPPALPSGRVGQATLEDGRTLVLRRAASADAGEVLRLMHAAFSSRPVVSSRPQALTETVDSVRSVIDSCAGYVVEVDGVPAACTLLRPDGDAYRFGRVSVHPGFQRFGIATTLVAALLEALAAAGISRVTLLARKEFPELERWWGRRGFRAVGEEGDCILMESRLPVVVEVPDADAMRRLGRRTAALVRAGDVIIATGDLGAGKTTFAQGLGAGMRVSGPIISPTFVLSRVHPSTDGGPAFVHVDAYRLGDSGELMDLDLDASLDGSVTLVEWGAGVAEPLSEDRLEIDIRRGLDPADETRWVFLTGIGDRWHRDEVASLAAPARRDPA